MNHLFKLFGLMLLLLTAQQGAVVHELGHAAGGHATSAGRAESRAAGGLLEAACALCPAFAQAATAALGHAFALPALLSAGLARTAEPELGSIARAALDPRSRGPPA